MSRTYMAYLEDAERQQMIFTKRFDVEAARIDLMMEMCDRRTALQIEEAELKVLSEGGTYEDLEYLYDCIMIEAGEQQKKLSIAERISQLIELILKGITGLFTGEAAINKVPNDETLNVQGYSNGKGILAKCKNFLSIVKEAIKNGIEGIINFASEHKLATFGLALVGGFIALTNDNDNTSTDNKTGDNKSTGSGKEETVTAGEAKEQITASEDILREISDIISEMNNAQKEYDKKIKSIENQKQKTTNNYNTSSNKIDSEIQNQEALKKDNYDHNVAQTTGNLHEGYKKFEDEINQRIKELKAKKKELEDKQKKNENSMTDEEKQAVKDLKTALDEGKKALKKLNGELHNYGLTVIMDYNSSKFGNIVKYRGSVKNPVTQQDTQNNNSSTGTQTNGTQETKTQDTNTSKDDKEKPETVRKAIKGIFDALWGFVKSIKGFIENLAGKLTDKAKELIGKIDDKVNKPESNEKKSEEQKDNTASAK